MIKEFVPETRSDKKDAEIARLRALISTLQVSLKCLLKLHEAHHNSPYHVSARAALAATEEK